MAKKNENYVVLEKPSKTVIARALKVVKAEKGSWLEKDLASLNTGDHFDPARVRVSNKKTLCASKRRLLITELIRTNVISNPFAESTERTETDTKIVFGPAKQPAAQSCSCVVCACEKPSGAKDVVSVEHGRSVKNLM